MSNIEQEIETQRANAARARANAARARAAAEQAETALRASIAEQRKAADELRRRVTAEKVAAEQAQYDATFGPIDRWIGIGTTSDGIEISTHEYTDFESSVILKDEEAKAFRDYLTARYLP